MDVAAVLLQHPSFTNYITYESLYAGDIIVVISAEETTSTTGALTTGTTTPTSLTAFASLSSASIAMTQTSEYVMQSTHIGGY